MLPPPTGARKNNKTMKDDNAQSATLPKHNRNDIITLTVINVNK